MKLGILFHNKKRLPLNVAVAQALVAFRAADHTNGHQPGEVRLHPSDIKINGLPLVADPDVRPGHLRIVAAENELEVAA